MVREGGWKEASVLECIVALWCRSATRVLEGITAILDSIRIGTWCCVYKTSM